MNLPLDSARLLFSDHGVDHSFSLESDTTTIGRSSDQDLILPEPFVSRRHAVIHRLEGGYEVVDQGSSHGTYLNGQRTDKAVLHDGDIL